MIYMCVMDYSSDRSLVAQVRPRHRAYMTALLAEGRAIAAGSFAPQDDGGLFLYEAASLADAELLVRADPYILEGAAVASKLREYNVHGVNRELMRATGASAKDRS